MTSSVLTTTTSAAVNLMPSEFRPAALTLRLFCALLLLIALSACGATSTTIIDEEVVTNPKPMYTYKTLIIRDFELKRELYSDLPDGASGQRENRFVQIPAELSGHIERYVKARRLYQSVAREGQPDAATLVVSGRFTRLGRFRISVTVTLLDGASGQEVAYFRQTLWDVVDTTATINDLGREVADFIGRIQYK